MSDKRKSSIGGEVLSAKESAAYAGLSEPTFRRHLSEIAHRRAGRRILVRKSALNAWLEGRDAAEKAV